MKPHERSEPRHLPVGRITWKQLLFSFKGRIGRRTYWLGFGLPAAVVFVVAAVLVPPLEFGRVMMVVLAVLSCPFVPVGVKRCHDRNKTGWFLLIWLVPFFGPLWLFVELGFLRGTLGLNRYGADPLAKPQRPIKYIIAEGSDLSFHSTKEEAECSLEAIDVKNGEYRGYDSEGRLLVISPRGQASEIVLAEEEPEHAEKLQTLLIEWLARRSRKPENVDLATMLALCERELL